MIADPSDEPFAKPVLVFDFASYFLQLEEKVPMTSQTDTGQFPTVEGLDKLLGIPSDAEKERAAGAATPNGSDIKAPMGNARTKSSADEAFSQVSLPWDVLNQVLQWVSWHEEDRKGRITRFPHRPSGGGLAKSDDPSGWGSRAAAQHHRLRS